MKKCDESRVARGRIAIAIGTLLALCSLIGGPPEYHFRLCKLAKAKFADFQPEGMAEWDAEQSEDRILDADTKLKDIVSDMRDNIFSVFKAMYGTEKTFIEKKELRIKFLKLLRTTGL